MPVYAVNIIFQLIHAGLAYLFLAPFARTLFRGLDSARDVNHRTVPRSPWFFFDRAVKKRMRRVWIAWGVVIAALACFYALPYLSCPVPFTSWFHLFILQVVPTVGWLALMIFWCLFWAPRCRKTWTLLALSLLLALIFRFIVSQILGILISILSLLFQPRMIAGIPVSVYLRMFLPSLVLATIPFLFWRWIRRRGEAWFRFEY